MEALGVIIFLAIIAIPGLIMMNVGVWQLKKAGEAFSSIRRQKDDLKIFEVQRKFYSLNPGKIESDFLAWYGDKKVQFSTMYSPYDPAKFGRWLTERGKPDSFYALSPSSSTSLLEITKNAHRPVNRLKSLERLKTEVTQKFFAEFPGATVEDFQNWQEEQRREMIPADFIPSLDPMEEETAVWEGFLAWLDYEEDDD